MTPDQLRADIDRLINWYEENKLFTDAGKRIAVKASAKEIAKAVGYKGTFAPLEFPYRGRTLVAQEPGEK